MGTRVYEISGGLPAYTGDKNWGDPNGASILELELDRWVDADNGSDANPGTETAPWASFTPLQALLEPYVEIRQEVTVHVVASTAPASFAALQLPRFRTPGKLVIVGEGTTTHVSFTADAGSSTDELVALGSQITGNPTGYILECTAGTLVGQRRTVAGYVDVAGDVTLYPSAPFDGTPDGTWRLQSPAAAVYFDDASWCSGATSEAFEATGNDPGVYLVNLLLQGVPVFTGLWLYIYSCEGYSDGLTPFYGMSIDFGRLSAGIAFQDLPWVDPNAALWNGCGLTMRQDASTEAGGAIGDLLFMGEQSVVLGYLSGTRLLALHGTFLLYGGVFFAHSGSRPTLLFTGDSQGTLGGQAAIPLFITGGTSAIVNVRASGPLASVTIEFVQFTGSGVGSSSILHAEFAAKIVVSDDWDTPTGSGNDYGTDSKGGGQIYYTHEPVITGSVADLRSGGATTGANALLAAAPSKFPDAADVGFIARW